MCHGTSSVHAPGTGSFRGRHRAPTSRLNKLSSPPTPECVYFLGHVPCGAARVQYLPIWRCRATLSVCGGEEDFFNMLLTCQDQPRPPAVRGSAPGTVRVTRVVLRLVRRAHSVEACNMPQLPWEFYELRLRQEQRLCWYHGGSCQCGYRRGGYWGSDIKRNHQAKVHEDSESDQYRGHSFFIHAS